MIIEPMDDFWKQMLDELENTTNEEWMQLIEDYERENRPMLEAIELCNQISELIEDLNEPRLLRFDDITIVSSLGSYDCYGDKCSYMVVKIYTEDERTGVIVRLPMEGVDCRTSYVVDLDDKNLGWEASVAVDGVDCKNAWVAGANKMELLPELIWDTPEFLN